MSSGNLDIASPGAQEFREMARHVNALALSHLAVQERLAEVVAWYAAGNVLDRLPGERAKIIDGVAAVRLNLDSAKYEIAKLAEKLARGALGPVGDGNERPYEAREIIMELNRLIGTSEAGMYELARLLGGLSPDS